MKKALHPADPLSRCKEARAAVQSKIDAHVAEGFDVFFNELTSTLSTFQAERCILAANCTDADLEIWQSDCLKSYIQADLSSETAYVKTPQGLAARG